MNVKIIGGAIIVVLVIVVVAAFLSMGSGSAPSSSSLTTAQTTSSVLRNSTAQSSASTTISNSSGTNVSSSAGSYTFYAASSPAVGSHIVNSTGWSVYMYKKDPVGTGNSSCYQECATIWHPVHGSASALVLPSSLNASDFSSFARTDGTEQLAYKGHPLYYYSGDTAAGQTNGEGILGLWYVVPP